MGGDKDVNCYEHYEKEAKTVKRVSVQGLNMHDWRIIRSLLKKANMEQLSKLASLVLKERLKRCGV